MDPNEEQIPKAINEEIQMEKVFQLTLKTCIHSYLGKN